MPTPKREVTPTGKTYQILVSKLGHDNDDWVAGKQVVDTDHPDIDFERLRGLGAVGLVRDDGSVVQPDPAQPRLPAAEGGETLTAPGQEVPYPGAPLEGGQTNG